MERGIPCNFFMSNDQMVISQMIKQRTGTHLPIVDECIFSGRCINVNLRRDGSLQLTFNRPHFNRDLTFSYFCRKAAEELLMVSGSVEED